jgi:hypothetical protein
VTRIFYRDGAITCWRCRCNLEEPATDEEARWIANDAEVRWAVTPLNGRAYVDLPPERVHIRWTLDGVRIVHVLGVEVAAGRLPVLVCPSCVTDADRLARAV